MTDAEIAWVAGLLEGEGSFMLGRSKCGDCRYSYARISINMTDRDVIEKIARITGAKQKIFTESNHRPRSKITSTKPIHRLWIDGAIAVEIMLLIRPWMGERRRTQIDFAIAEHRKSAPSEEQKKAQRLYAAKRAWEKMGAKTPEQRREVMRKVWEARWGKKTTNEEVNHTAA